MRETGKYVSAGPSANKVVVFDLLEELRLAWQDILNAYPGQKGHEAVKYIDAAMTIHNFHKLALDHVIDEAEMDAGAAEAFLIGMRDTFSRAIDTEIWKRRERSETGTTVTGHTRAVSMADAIEMGLLAINRAEQRAKGKHKEKPVQGTDQ